ncbi:TldD/PmbA family protein [Candidatus Woesearchaeota archaeon]|nr:TldD/PmbA family protein [Candidatus Woesearchaeota archaeon]
MIDSKIVSYLKKRVDQYELYSATDSSLQVVLQNNKIDFVNQGQTSGLGVRVVVDGKIGFASTLSLNNYQECIQQAIKTAKLNAPDKKFKQFVVPETYSKVQSLHPALKSLTIDDIQDYLHAVLASVSDAQLSISTATYEKNITAIHILNSQGVDLTSSFGSNGFSEELLKNGETLSFGQEEKTPLDPAILQEHISRFHSFFPRNHIQTQTVPLLFHPDALSSLFGEAFEFALNAENVQLKKSIFAGKLQQNVFDKQLTITDTALDESVYGARSFDDEGTACRNLNLIKNGVLQSYLYDSYAAHAEGTKSTGHAHRSYNSLPHIGSNNLVITPGKDSVSDLLKRMKNGLFVKQVLGTHTMKESTGDFSLGIYEGNMVEHGDVKEGIKDAMIVGNFFALLKNVTALSKEVAHNGSYYMPYILFPKIKVVAE